MRTAFVAGYTKDARGEHLRRLWFVLYSLLRTWGWPPRAPSFTIPRTYFWRKDWVKYVVCSCVTVAFSVSAPFPGYTTIPTTQNQTFVFSPLSVINSQPSILPTHNQPTVSGINQQQKQNDMHKVRHQQSNDMPKLRINNQMIRVWIMVRIDNQMECKG